MNGLSLASNPFDDYSRLFHGKPDIASISNSHIVILSPSKSKKRLFSSLLSVVILVGWNETRPSSNVTLKHVMNVFIQVSLAKDDISIITIVVIISVVMAETLSRDVGYGRH